MNILKAAISWLLTKHVKKGQPKMSKIALALSAVAGVVADGITVNTLTVTATDDSGIPLVGSAVTVADVNGVSFTGSNLVTDANGQVTEALTSNQAGTYQVTVTLADGTAASINVTFSPVDTALERFAAATQSIATGVEDETEAFIATLKKLVAAAGSQAHAVFDDLIELAKKLK